MEHTHLRRFSRLHVSDPLYFITTCVANRRALLADPHISEILIDEWQTALERHRWAIGSYVIMPDHVHFFCRSAGSQVRLSTFVGRWKEYTAKRVCRMNDRGSVWQREFFDHVLRSDESYGEKWTYVRENPVRAGLVSAWQEWPYQGHVHFR